MISTCLALIGLLHPLVYIASAEGQYGPLQPPQCGYSNVSHAEVHIAVPAKRDAWPWAVALGYNSSYDMSELKWRCAATLISSRHVLTGAVCASHRDLKVARIGASNLDGDDDGAQPIDVEIEEKIVHPEYNPTRFKNDIAVLKLAKEVPFSDRVRPICLPLTNALQNKNLSGSYAAGWGPFADFHSYSVDLMEVQVRVDSDETCREAYSSYKKIVIDNRVLCVSSINAEEEPCKGASGAPLMLPQGSAFYQIGFVSYGTIGGKKPSVPCAYTRVSAYMDFITSALK